MKKTWLREELIHLLSVSGTLAGLCITGVTLLHSGGHADLPKTLADDALALTALLFLMCCYLIFFALRTTNPTLASRLEHIVDTLFLAALTIMVAAGLVMVYTLW